MAKRGGGGSGGSGGGGGGGTAEILETLRDFTSKENWDKFFTLRGAGDYFEWYAGWASLKSPLISLLSGEGADELQILVPGCGSSSLSEKLYDAGYRRITNIDFSKVVVSDMLRRNVRSRPEMRWRVMDMTDMQFADECFEVVLDKGGLDALMEPELGSELGSKYLKEVKRVLKSGGKYLCLTLTESHVLGLLFAEFRFGWETSISAIPHEPESNTKFQTFMVTIVKEKMDRVNQIMVSLDQSTLFDDNKKQVHALVSTVETENKIREKYSSDGDIIYTLEALQLEAKGNMKELRPGRRCNLILGEHGDSLYRYKTVVLDAQKQSDPFSYHCGVFIVPKIRAHEWLFTSEEGQWLVVESSKAARLIMVFLDSTHSCSSMDEIQKDLSSLVRNVAPGEPDDGAKIPFMMTNDGVKQRKVVQKVMSSTTGPIIVEDVMYENVDCSTNLISSEDRVFRRLIFERSIGLVQSEALLIKENLRSSLSETEKRGNHLSSKSRKKGSRKRNDPHSTSGSISNLKVDHTCLASSYHSGIISGFALIASALEKASSLSKKVETIIIGLGAGLLPMFLHGCIPVLDIEVVELDPVIFDVARDYFGFTGHEKLKVHIGDGIEFIQKRHFRGCSKLSMQDQKVYGDCEDSLANGNESFGTKILIIDADASNLSSGLTCPPVDFVEEPFLLAVKDFLSEGGLFVINLVSRSPAIRETIVSRMKTVFNHVFSLELEEDVNEVLFASSSEVCTDMEHLPEETARLRKLMDFPLSKSHDQATKNIKSLK